MKQKSVKFHLYIVINRMFILSLIRSIPRFINNNQKFASGIH